MLNYYYQLGVEQCREAVSQELAQGQEKQASMAAFFSSKKFQKAKAALKKNKMKVGLGAGAAAIGAGVATGAIHRVKDHPAMRPGTAGVSVEWNPQAKMDKEGSFPVGSMHGAGYGQDFAEQAAEYGGKAANAVRNVAGQGADFARGVASRGSDMAQSGWAAAKAGAQPALDAAGQLIQENPMAAAGIGAGVGAAGIGAGMMARRQSQSRMAQLASKIRSGHVSNHAGKIGLGLAAAGGLGYLASNHNK